MMNDLSPEIIYNIFKFIPKFMFPLSICKVNKQFNDISKYFDCGDKNNFQEQLISLLDESVKIENFEFISKFGTMQFKIKN